jgi:hypothetical protein
MWTCRACGRTFASQNQVHTCARLGDVDQHFARSEPVVRATFDRVLAVIAGLGPVQVLAEKTRIALHARMSFAAFIPRRRWLAGHLILARPIASPRFTRIETFSPGNVLHQFRLSGPDEVDEQFAAWLAEAYQVGIQQVTRAAAGPLRQTGQRLPRRDGADPAR